MRRVARIRVIACGNPQAGDDAAGLAAVRAARGRLARLAGVEVVEAGTATRLLDLMEGVDAAVVVDAVRAPGGDRPPGTLVRAEAEPGGRLGAARGALSSHGVGVEEVLGIAGALGGARRVVFLGVEADGVRMGDAMSAEVAAAIPDLERAIVAEAKRLAGEVRG